MASVAGIGRSAASAGARRWLPLFVRNPEGVEGGGDLGDHRVDLSVGALAWRDSHDSLCRSEPVTVAYTYQAVMSGSGNHLFFDIEQPTRDLRIDFDYTGTGITKVNVLDLVPSIRPTRIETPIEGSGSETIRLDMDGWVPTERGGVHVDWND
ncbi:MAG TPA: hypothetical protein PKE56_08635 [Acidimicrobiales bacterium]|nr:hypothetical protein [Acidimicrobiales bacterium]